MPTIRFGLEKLFSLDSSRMICTWAKYTPLGTSLLNAKVKWHLPTIPFGLEKHFSLDSSRMIYDFHMQYVPKWSRCGRQSAHELLHTWNEIKQRQMQWLCIFAMYSASLTFTKPGHTIWSFLHKTLRWHSYLGHFRIMVNKDLNRIIRYTNDNTYGESVFPWDRDFSKE